MFLQLFHSELPLLPCTDGFSFLHETAPQVVLSPRLRLLATTSLTAPHSHLQRHAATFLPLLSTLSGALLMTVSFPNC